MTEQADKIHEILSKRPRRIALLLVKQEETVSVTELVTRLSGGEDDHEVRIRLAHNHLPKLSETEYIEYNRGSDEISKGSQFAELEPVLEFFETYADRTSIEWP